MLLKKIFVLLIVVALPAKAVFAISQTNEPVATANDVIVIYNSNYVTDSDNDSVQDSLELANYYKNKRSIPNSNVIGVSAPLTEVITRTEYNTLKSAVETAITNAGLENSAKYLVLIKGMPLKIYPTSGTTSNISGDYASVDSAMTILYQSSHAGGGKNDNPYFDTNIYNDGYNYTFNLEDLSYRFKTNTFSLGSGEYLKFLVTRLDAYTVSDVKDMIDRAYNADTSGTGYFILDGKTNLGPYDYMPSADNGLSALRKNFYPNPFSRGSSAITSAPGSVIGYSSYGKYTGLPADYYGTVLDFTYLNGAVTATHESWNNYTYTEDNSGTSPYELHGQVAQFIRAGGSGGIGNVYEPFSSAIAHEGIWMPAYAAGYTWADAAYMSLAYIDWATVVTGDPLMRIVNPSISTPTVTTSSASSITDTTAVFNGNITSTGGESNTERGFEYGVTSSYGSSTSTTGTYSTGTFSISATGLLCDTTYHYRAFAKNSFRTGYGSDTTFTTGTCLTPSLTTSSATSILSLSATLNGSISNVGVANPTVRGFQYGTTTSYGTTTTEAGNFSTGSFSASISNLSCNTTYHFRSYATNTSGTDYGSDTTFTTLTTCPPTITTDSASSVDSTSAILNGNITNGGNEPVTLRGFEYGTTSSYGSSTSESGTFSSQHGFLLKIGSTDGNANGQFSSPRSVAVDSLGNIYVADRLNHRIQKFDSTGTYTSSWGSFGTGNSQFEYPRGVAIYETSPGTGFIYVADSDNQKVKKFDLNGTYITSWGGYGTGNGKISYPQDVVVDSSGNVYVSDYDNARISKFTSSGVYVTKWGSSGSSNGQFNVPYDLGIDSSNNIYVADSANHRIQKFDSTGTFITSWGSFGTSNGQFSTPSGVVVDSDGYVYVSDSGNHRIQKFDSTGTFITSWGSSGSVNNKFNNPQGLGIDSSDNIYVADLSNHRIQKFANSSSTFSYSLTGLSCGTYHYRSYATNTIGTTYGSDTTFTTSTCPDTIPPSLSSITVTNTNTSSVTINWSTDEESSSSVSYGRTSTYDTTTPESDTSPMVTTHSVDLSGLSCGTTYHYSVISIDASNNSSSDTDHTFTTSSCPVVSSGGGGGGGGGGSSRSTNTVLGVISVPKIINVPLVKVQNFKQSKSIKLGSKGENVKILQTFLSVQGPDIFPQNSKIDGVFGKITDQAVKKFQSKNKLTPDGVVGQKTKAAIDVLNTQKYCFVSQDPAKKC